MFKEDDLILGKMAETVRGDLKTPEASVAQESDEDASGADFDARGWRLPIISRRQAQERLKCCYSALIEPVEHLLDEEQHLIIVPDHHLWMFPFAALQLPSGKYLIEKFSIRLAPSVQTLMQISRRREQISRMPALTPTALVVGVSKFSGHTELQLQPLPSVPSECKGVCEACGRAGIVVQHVMEHEASAQSFVDRCPHATHLIHIATHGLLEQPALVLHGTPASAIFPASEIQALRISSRVVVLSACNTGRGSVGADGVFGLTRSFLVAGADLVMGTLWHTGDASSQVFMSGFYSYLLDSGLTEHVAVQQAMCAMIHETDARGKLRLILSAKPELAHAEGPYKVRFKPHRFTQTAMHRALESRRARQAGVRV
ncbi:TTC28 [Symbiodinium sp. CCMP2456]|nr:TTC28 [Symbiodinium sp. CCMP2456]